MFSAIWILRLAPESVSSTVCFWCIGYFLIYTVLLPPQACQVLQRCRSPSKRRHLVSGVSSVDEEDCKACQWARFSKEWRDRAIGFLCYGRDDAVWVEEVDNRWVLNQAFAGNWRTCSTGDVAMFWAYLPMCIYVYVCKSSHISGADGVWAIYGFYSKDSREF